MVMNESDWKLAKLSPSEFFANPEEVRDRADLTLAQKVELLRSWAYDESELLVAEEEGMGRGERADAEHVLRVLHELTGGFDTEHTPPTKQGGA